PYQLDPKAPKIPSSRSKMIERKFGQDRRTQIQDWVSTAAKAVGIKIKYSNDSLYCNTLDSHRLLRYARELLGPPRRRHHHHHHHHHHHSHHRKLLSGSGPVEEEQNEESDEEMDEIGA